MALIDDMIEAQEEEIVGYTDFMISFKRDSLVVFCFYEAKDDEVYYNPIIRNVLGIDDHESFTCRNKDGVLRVYSLIKRNSEYAKSKAGFFIDRDFDILYNNNDIYETPFYSVENFYVGDDTLKKVLYEQFRIDKGSMDFDSGIQLYEKLQNSFHEKVLTINAWLSCHAAKRREGVTVRLNIDSKIGVHDCVLSDLSDVKVKDLVLPLSLEEIEKIFGNQGVVSKEEFDKKVEEFKNTDNSKVFRGKFELQFLASFLKQFKNAVEPKKNYLLSQRYKCTLQYSYENIITQLNSYAHVPPCLREYIRRIAV